MTRSAGPLILTLLIASFLFSGCVSIEKSYPDKRYFVFDIARTASQQESAGNGVLQIVTARVSPRYADRNFVYRRSDTRFESDFYNQFLISPAALVTEELRRGLSQAGIFKFVVGASNPLPATHTMETIVNTLYGDFRDLKAPKAVIEMEFFLNQELSPGGIIFHKLYQRIIPVRERNPEALVQGWNQGFEAISSSLISDLKAAQLRKEK
jgi:cholesterol transport system auxiliary component